MRICKDLIGINTFEIEIEVVDVDEEEAVADYGQEEYVMESPAENQMVMMSAIPETTGEYRDDEAAAPEEVVDYVEEVAPAEYYEDQEAIAAEEAEAEMAEAVEEAVEELVEAVEELVEDETGYGVEAVEGEESLEDVADGDAEDGEEAWEEEEDPEAEIDPVTQERPRRRILRRHGRY